MLTKYVYLPNVTKIKWKMGRKPMPQWSIISSMRHALLSAKNKKIVAVQTPVRGPWLNLFGSKKIFHCIASLKKAIRKIFLKIYIILKRHPHILQKIQNV